MQVTIEVPDNRIADILCNALEGGSNYWYNIEEFIAPPPSNLFAWDHDLKEDDGSPSVFRHVQYPLSIGGALIISDREGDNETKRYRLDRDSIASGLSALIAKFPQSFGAILAEQDDALTADTFLQCCLFGDALYG